MDDQVKQRLITNTKEFLDNPELLKHQGLCGKLAGHGHDRLWNISYTTIKNFMRDYIPAGEVYISPQGEVTPERIKAAKHFLKWLESQ